MKKIVALLLALVVMFALCGCGKSEADANTQIVQEVVYVPGQVNQNTPDRYLLNDLPEELAEPVGDENFVVEAVRTEVMDYGSNTRYDISVKVRNLTEFSPPAKYSIGYTLIDKNGDALHKTRQMGSTDIPPSGTAQWLEAGAEIEGVAGIRLLSYHVFGDEGELIGDTYFDSPIEFYYENYQMEYRKMY